MTEFYVGSKIAHITCVVLSGSLFTLRGIMMIKGSSMVNHRALRLISYIIDTTLLVAAITLAFEIHQFPFLDAWLTVKLGLLIAYVGLGMMALHRGRTRQIRAAFMVAALLVYGLIVSVAVTHDPLGILRGLVG